MMKLQKQHELYFREPKLFELPEDLIGYLLRFLGLQELCESQIISKTFQHYCIEVLSSSQKVQILNNARIVAKYCTKIKDLQLITRADDIAEVDFAQVIQKNKDKITKLILDCSMRSTDNLFFTTLDFLPRLTHLELHGPPLTKHLFHNCVETLAFDPENIEWLDVDTNLGGLKRLYLGDRVRVPKNFLKSLAHRCEQLVFLAVTLSPEVVLELQFFKHLRNLQIGMQEGTAGTKVVFDLGHPELANCFGGLEVLSLETEVDMNGLGRVAGWCKSLRQFHVLSITSSHLDHRFITMFLLKCKSITEFHCSLKNVALDPVFDELLQKRVHLPGLTGLRMFDEVSPTVIPKIAALAPNLKNLELESRQGTTFAGFGEQVESLRIILSLNSDVAKSLMLLEKIANNEVFPNLKNLCIGYIYDGIYHSMKESGVLHRIHKSKPNCVACFCHFMTWYDELFEMR